MSYHDIVYDIEGFLTFDIEGHVGCRYRIRYSIHPMSFTAERKLPLSRRHHAGAEGSQLHGPWILVPKTVALNIERIASCLRPTVEEFIFPLDASKRVEMAMWTTNEIASDDCV